MYPEAAGTRARSSLTRRKMVWHRLTGRDSHLLYLCLYLDIPEDFPGGFLTERLILKDGTLWLVSNTCDIKVCSHHAHWSLEESLGTEAALDYSFVSAHPEVSPLNISGHQS